MGAEGVAGDADVAADHGVVVELDVDGGHVDVADVGVREGEALGVDEGDALAAVAGHGAVAHGDVAEGIHWVRSSVVRWWCTEMKSPHTSVMVTLSTMAPWADSMAMPCCHSMVVS